MTIKKAYADCRDGQIHYRALPEGNGTPLVFFHRAPSSSLSFEKMMNDMAGDRPLYAFDTPGYGQSFDPVGKPDILAYRDWMIEAIDVVGLNTFHIFGHHTGTHFGTEMAVAYPERVKSLMLNGVAYLTADERAEFSKGTTDKQTPDAGGAYALDIFNKLAGFAKSFDAETLHQDFVGALRSLEGRPQSFTAVWNQDYPAALAKVTCPILATSAEDDLFAAYLDRVAAAHPEARTIMLGPAMIWTPELDTERVVKEVRAFLKDVEGAHS